MIPNVFPTIPRIYTALAQWLSCLTFVLLCYRQRRWKGATLVWGLILGLIALSTEMVLTAGVPVAFWIPSMLGAAVLMYGILWFCCDIDYVSLGHCCAWAFLVSEFAASLSWQLYYYSNRYFSDGLSELRVLVTTLIVYALAFTLNYLLLRTHIHDGKYLQAGVHQLIYALIICIAAFAISNLSFVAANTPFTSSIDTAIYNIRTLVDLGGLAFLYAFNVQQLEMKARYERDVIQNVLETQYAQYRQSKESIDLVNQKYHDLKHQIALLRAETDPETRNRWLDEIERDIAVYEAQNNTGNVALDTVLTSQSLRCHREGISFTCVVDGTLLSFMTSMDICTIFGNALDNAVEAVLQVDDPEKRLIHLSVSAQRSFLLIRVENYFEGDLRMENGLPKSSKGDDRFHGFGVKSIRYSAQRYGGTVSISTENHWFDLKILIPIDRN